MHILSVNKWWYSKDLHTLGASRGVMLGHRALVRRGHKVDHVFIDDVCRERKLRFSYLQFPILILPKIMRLTAEPKYDVVEISSGDGWLYGLLRQGIGRAVRPVFVATSAGLEHCMWEEAFRDHELGLQEFQGIRARVLRPFMIMKEVEIAIRASDHFVPVRQSDAEYVLDKGWKKASGVTVIPRGVGTEYFVEREATDCADRLLFVGTWHPRKGTKYLIDAFSILKKDYPSLQLSLIGTRAGEELLQDFPVWTRDSVRVVKLMSPEAVVREYASHDAFILPSTQEGCPKVLLEAMAAGMPVVASHGAGSDLIEHGVDGFLVPNRDSQALADAVERLLVDRGLRQQLGETARAEARKYIWDKIAIQYESLYVRLLEDRR